MLRPLSLLVPDSWWCWIKCLSLASLQQAMARRLSSREAKRQARRFTSSQEREKEEGEKTCLSLRRTCTTFLSFFHNRYGSDSRRRREGAADRWSRWKRSTSRAHCLNRSAAGREEKGLAMSDIKSQQRRGKGRSSREYRRRERERAGFDVNDDSFARTCIYCMYLNEMHKSYTHSVCVHRPISQQLNSFFLSSLMRLFFSSRSVPKFQNEQQVRHSVPPAGQTSLSSLTKTILTLHSIPSDRM